MSEGRVTPVPDLDGLTGTGGCEYCEADFEVVVEGDGRTSIHLYHDEDCESDLVGRTELFVGDPQLIDSATRSVLGSYVTQNRAQRRANKKKGK